MRRDPRQNNHADADEAQNHSQTIPAISAHHDVVHIAHEARHRDQGHMHGDEGTKAEHR